MHTCTTRRVETHERPSYNLRGSRCAPDPYEKGCFCDERRGMMPTTRLRGAHVKRHRSKARSRGTGTLLDRQRIAIAPNPIAKRPLSCANPGIDRRGNKCPRSLFCNPSSHDVLPHGAGRHSRAMTLQASARVDEWVQRRSGPRPAGAPKVKEIAGEILTRCTPRATFQFGTAPGGAP